MRPSLVEVPNLYEARLRARLRLHELGWAVFRIWLWARVRLRELGGAGIWLWARVRLRELGWAVFRIPSGAPSGLGPNF